jgi:isoquinoline 1-oxidoreductase alpha subunit
VSVAVSEVSGRRREGSWYTDDDPRRAGRCVADRAIRRAAMLQLTVNDKQVQVDAPAEMPLLWALRDLLGLTGTKFGCGVAQCGACTVHLDGQPVRSCITPVGTVAGKRITTIEGLAAGGDHPVQTAWARLNVPQCGYCQAGQIMTAAALLAAVPDPSDRDIDAAMAGNLCRCGTYVRIRAAVHEAARLLGTSAGSSGAGDAGSKR